MPAILIDVNIRGQVRVLERYWQSIEWHELWTSLNCPVHTFASVGLPIDARDSEVWTCCQARRFVLLTANRNKREPDSLEAVIRASNTPDCLPVLTIGDADRIPLDRAYAERTAIRIMEYLLELEAVRGTGRLYVP